MWSAIPGFLEVHVANESVIGMKICEQWVKMILYCMIMTCRSSVFSYHWGKREGCIYGTEQFGVHGLVWKLESRLKSCTVEPHYNEDLGTIEIAFLYNRYYIYLAIRGFCYEVPLYKWIWNLCTLECLLHYQFYKWPNTKLLYGAWGTSKISTCIYAWV